MKSVVIYILLIFVASAGVVHLFDSSNVSYYNTRAHDNVGKCFEQNNDIYEIVIVNGDHMIGRNGKNVTSVNLEHKVVNCNG